MGKPEIILIFILAPIALAIFFSPYIIAAKRNNHYKNIILALGGWTAAGWFAALIWALWLQRTSIVDAVILPSSNPDEKLSKLSYDLLGINNSRNETKMSELRIFEQFTS